MDPDQDNRRSVDLDLGPNHLQRFRADNKSRCEQAELRNGESSAFSVSSKMSQTEDLT